MNEDDLNKALITFWITYTDINKLGKISADDLLYQNHINKEDKKLTKIQLKVVETYCRLWSLIN